MSPFTALFSLGVGLAFGAVLQRVQASSPDRILGTLTLRDTTILKFMLLAIGVGATGIAVLQLLGLAHLNVKPLALLGVGLGGLVFGIGFAIAGYCPGTCLVGAAEGRKDAPFTVLGGLLGALAYAAFFPVAKASLLTPLSFGRPTLATVTGLPPGLVGLAFGALMTTLALVLPTNLRKRANP